MVLFAMLLLLLATALIHNSLVLESAKLAEETYGKKQDCLRLAGLISEVYSQGSGTKATLETKNNAAILNEQRIVQVGEEYCGFLGNAPATDIPAGEVTIQRIGSGVAFS